MAPVNLLYWSIDLGIVIFFFLVLVFFRDGGDGGDRFQFLRPVNNSYC